MTMMEHIKCKNCDKVSRELHLCRVDETGKNVPWKCEHCGEKEVKYGHFDKKLVESLKFTCGFCGRVAPEEDFLCEPKPIPEAVKATYKDAKYVNDLAVTCEVCGQPIVMPGHTCDKKENYTCKYCGKFIDISKPGGQHHMCSEIINKAKYFCRVCGRLAVEPWEICTPIEFK
ncbi:MAG: hypothetical protein ACTSVY_00805 [Candidatus Helarchaeota archaeon]